MWDAAGVFRVKKAYFPVSRQDFCASIGDLTGSLTADIGASVVIYPVFMRTFKPGLEAPAHCFSAGPDILSILIS